MNLRGIATLTVLAVVALTARGAQASDGADESIPSSDAVAEEPGPEFRGEAAVEMLAEAGITEEVAASVDLAPDVLIDELRNDETLFVTEGGMVGYIDTGHVELAPLSEPLVAAPLSAPNDVCNLESRPSSTRVLYLDFNGHTTVGDQWNAVYTGGAPIVSQPFSRDARPTFSSTERAQIYEVWQRVAEDFAPFDVNVTTRDPGAAGLQRSSPSDVRYGQRMVISPTNWTGVPTTIGMAYVGTFSSAFDHSAFVFVTPNRTPSAAEVAEAVSHEAGHTFGLLHDGWSDGSSDREYYEGHGAWAPLMGYPLGKAVTQWSRGEYSTANNFEDDIARIGSMAGTVADDWPNTVATAGAATTDQLIQGMIGSSSDIDVIRFRGSGDVDVRLRPTGPGSNLRARITLRDASGTVISAGDADVPINPTGTWAVQLEASSLALGDYTLEISPLGWGTASSGFTTYGSLGRYEIAISTPSGSLGVASASRMAERLSVEISC